ncbi:MAG: hypothetical protein QNI86_15365 [Halieaceae bacterium]|nr:hypothetical protein [Halieaceae bacterium]
MRVILIAILTMCILPAHSESPIDCIDPDFANTLLRLPGQATPTYSSTVPPGNQLPPVPDSFELIGSRNMQNAVLVAYKSGQPPAAAIGELRSEPSPGWKMNNEDTGILYGGFRLQASRTPDTTFQLCRDGVGQARISVRGAESSGSYATVMLYKNQVVCDEISKPRFLDEDRPKIPLLLLPEDASLLDSLGTGGGGKTMSTGALFKTALPMATTMAAFNDQLLEQGWTLEASWSGSSTQGSAWMSSDNDSYGVLSLAVIGNGAFQGVFNAVALRQAAETGSVSTSAISIMQSN